MSRERELLLLITKRFQEEFNNPEWYSEVDKQIIAEIYGLIAEPEPNMNVGYWNGYPNTYLLTVDEYNQHKDNENYDAIKHYVYPLYTSPPKREQLSDEELSILATDDLYECTYTTTVFAYKEYAKKIEKAHGIGE